jgi:sulfatase modifying factor 1
MLHRTVRRERLVRILLTSLAGTIYACSLDFTVGPTHAILTDGGGADAADAQEDRTAPPTPPPSCQGLPKTCGGTRDCCESPTVPGDTFNRSNDASYPATVSTFRLDAFEVTVGRFRAFVNAGKGTQESPPGDGEGAHPHLDGSGWIASFNAGLPATKAALLSQLKGDPTIQPWSDAPGTTENHPINQITWYLAFAFCAWDGGFLPTEAEWNFAASHGKEQRTYPWGNAAPDNTRASYGCNSSCKLADLTPVGAHSPQGDSYWGHADMAGNLWEVMLDADGPYPVPCTDCAIAPSGTSRVRRGGNISNGPSEMSNASRSATAASDSDYYSGFRCARGAL